jgi:hypothetical protein
MAFASSSPVGVLLAAACAALYPSRVLYSILKLAWRSFLMRSSKSRCDCTVSCQHAVPFNVWCGSPKPYPLVQLVNSTNERWLVCAFL